MLLTLTTLREKEQELRCLEERLNDARKERTLSRSQTAGMDNFSIEECVRKEAMLLKRIDDLRQQIESAEIVEEDVKSDSITIGSIIAIELDYGDGDVEEVNARVVDWTNNLLENEISVNSPIGECLLGKRAGEKTKAVLPNGNTVNISILSIS